MDFDKVINEVELTYKQSLILYKILNNEIINKKEQGNYECLIEKIYKKIQ